MLSRITALLDALWQLQARLPAQAVRMLQAGQAAETGFRGMTAVSDAVRVELLQKMCASPISALFDDPRRAAARWTSWWAATKDRLRTEAGPGRTAVNATDGRRITRRWLRSGDPADYLRKVEALLDEYPAVRQLIETHQLWTPAPTMRGVTDPGTPEGPVQPSPRPGCRRGAPARRRLPKR